MLQLEFGASVVCTDGPCGQIVGAALHPTWRLTHLVVRERHQHGVERLVPVALITTIGKQVEIRCTTQQFDHLDFADEGSPGPNGDVSSAIVVDQMSSLPLIDDKRVSTSPSFSDEAATFAHMPGDPDTPRGHVHLRSGDRIDATDGYLGALDGLQIDPASAMVLGLVVSSRHLFGRGIFMVSTDEVDANGSVLRVNSQKSSVRHQERLT